MQGTSGLHTSNPTSTILYVSGHEKDYESEHSHRTGMPFTPGSGSASERAESWASRSSPGVEFGEICVSRVDM
jgi:hypothetical protein